MVSKYNHAIESGLGLGFEARPLLPDQALKDWSRLLSRPETLVLRSQDWRCQTGKSYCIPVLRLGSLTVKLRYNGLLRTV